SPTARTVATPGRNVRDDPRKETLRPSSRIQRSGTEAKMSCMTDILGQDSCATADSSPIEGVRPPVDTKKFRYRLPSNMSPSATTYGVGHWPSPPPTGKRERHVDVTSSASVRVAVRMVPKKPLSCRGVNRTAPSMTPSRLRVRPPHPVLTGSVAWNRTWARPHLPSSRPVSTVAALKPRRRNRKAESRRSCSYRCSWTANEYRGDLVPHAVPSPRKNPA